MIQERTKNQGLTAREVEKSRHTHGINTLTRKKPTSLFRRFLSNLNDPIIRILLAALAVNLCMVFRSADWVETAGIAVAIFLASLISTLSEHGSERAFAKLSEDASRILCRVRRDGTVRQIPIGEIVVGDVVLLGAGEMIPADGLLIEGRLQADQSALTGEGREIPKSPSSDTSLNPDSPSSVLRGCTVTSGGGEMLVRAVGDTTLLGEISKEIQEEPGESPLKERLSRLARQISRLGYVAAVLVALAYLFNAFFLDSGMNWAVIRMKFTAPAYLFEQLLHAFTLGLTVIVVAVPEGLPMMIAVVLSANIRKMVRDQVLVRKPVGIEAAGSMNILFTDKTGTLTEGKMQVSHLIQPSGDLLSFGDFLRSGGELPTLFALAFRFGNDATVGIAPDGSQAVLGGSSTERALLTAVLPLPVPDGYRVTSRLPFDSARKYSAVSLGGRQSLTLIVGAPERLLPHTQSAMGAEGEDLPFSRRRIEDAIRARAGRGERILAVAVSRENIPAELHANAIRGSLTLLGAVSICDPLRSEASKSVAELQDAGIRVVMITGDNRETAYTIAKSCGIVTPSVDLILTGEELAALSDHKIRELLPRLAVVSRALPTDKSRLVRISQEAGLVVGMTGDGINDAPALRRADVGFAMGSGTQVAKDAGDIIILDNNLASIVRAVLYGRTVFKSIRKFITLQLTMNFCAVGVTVICPFLGIDSPVTVVQMLWINMIMDTLGGLAFAGEAPLPDCMRDRPKRRDEPILNRYMVNEILLLGGFTVALCLFFLTSPAISAVYRHAGDKIYLMTAFFALFIFSSVFNCFNARTDRLKLSAGIKKNPIFIAIMCAILVIQIGFTYLGGEILRTAPLTLREMTVTMLLSLAVFPAELIRKALWRLRGRKNGY